MDFKAMRKQYGKKLSYEQPGGFPEMLSFEGILLSKVNELMQKKAPTDDDLKWLTYSALFLVNTNTAIDEGLLDTKLLPEANLFGASSTDLRDTLVTRSLRVEAMLEHVLSFGRDPRVSRWLLAAKWHTTKYSGRVPTEDEVREYIDTAKKDVFSFTSIYVVARLSNFYHPDLEEAFRETAIRWSNLQINCGIDKKIPCIVAPFIAKTPHGIEGGELLLGDFFAQLYEVTPLAEADLRYDYLRRARKAWRLSKFPFLAGLNVFRWEFYSTSKTRMKTYREATADEYFQHPINWTTQDQRKTFYCSTCHTR